MVVDSRGCGQTGATRRRLWPPHIALPLGPSLLNLPPLLFPGSPLDSPSLLPYRRMLRSFLLLAPLLPPHPSRLLTRFPPPTHFLTHSPFHLSLLLLLLPLWFLPLPVPLLTRPGRVFLINNYIITSA